MEYNPIPARSSSPTSQKVGPVVSQNASPSVHSDVSSLMLKELRDLKELSLQVARPLKTQTLWNGILQVVGLLAAAVFGIFAALAWKVATDGNDAAFEGNTLALQGYAVATSANSLAIQAYSAAVTANSLASIAAVDARQANKIALLDQCQSVLSDSSADAVNVYLCSAIRQDFSQSLSIYASAYYQITLSTSTDLGSSTSATTSSRPDISSAATSTQSTSRTSMPTATPSTSGHGAAAGNTGIIAGAVFGGLAGLALISALPFLVYRERNRRAEELSQLYAHDRPRE